MDGLLVYSDILASWLSGFNYIWYVLNTNIITYLESVAKSSIGPSDLVFGPIILFLKNTFFADYTLLSFIFSMFGVGFGFYFAFTLVKWILNLIT